MQNNFNNNFNSNQNFQGQNFQMPQQNNSGGSWNDFNSAESQYDLIPNGTIAKVRMTIKPGGYDDHSKNWDGGYAIQGDTGSVYLACEFVVLEGQFAKRKVWSMIGLESSTGKPTWGEMGRSFIRAILSSSRGVSDKDNSLQAQKARIINGFADLDGIEFLAKIDVKKETKNGVEYENNEIRFAVTPEQKAYGVYYGIPSNKSLAPQNSANNSATNNSFNSNHYQAPLTPPTGSPVNNQKSQERLPAEAILMQADAIPKMQQFPQSNVNQQPSAPTAMQAQSQPKPWYQQ